MLLAREFVAYTARQLVRKLTPGTIETSDPDLVANKIAEVLTEELAVEDRLNDEVRDLLNQYSDYMRREGVSYQEMFRRIKNTLISQRKVIRASGRDSRRRHEAIARQSHGHVPQDHRHVAQEPGTAAQEQGHQRGAPGNSCGS